MRKENKSKSNAFRFTKMEIWEVSIPFNFQVNHSLASRENSRTIIVALYTNNGVVGYGEVLTRPYLTGETNETAWEDIRNRWWSRISALTFSKESPKEKLYPVYLEADQERKNASYSGIDLAVYDAWSKETNQSIEDAFVDGEPSYHSKPKGTFPLLGSDGRRLKLLCMAGKLMGFKDFKLKVGIRSQDDIRRIKMARKALGPKVKLYVDANTNWGAEYCIEKEKFLLEHGVSCIEQPSERNDLDGMAKIERETALSVMVDESLCTRKDAKEIISKKASSVWNVRIGKVGGFTGFFTLAKIAKENNIDLCCGCLVGESALLYSALLHCLRACSPKRVEYPHSGILLKENCFVYDREGELGNKAMFFNSFPKLSEFYNFIFIQGNPIVKKLESLSQLKKKLKKTKGGLGVRLDLESMKELTVRYEKLLAEPTPSRKKEKSPPQRPVASRSF